MGIKEACEFVGALKCEFGPDEDECETCGKSHKQLYYIRECYEVDEGSYHCARCIKKMPKAMMKEADHFVKEFERSNHDTH